MYSNQSKIMLRLEFKYMYNVKLENVNTD